ncbi:hypothetical protein [Streptomyces sp. CRN 30]|uniref:hypothetical protein n=1 Tax=Streptomyces sp. CRN 30 TaxID=3075613 RepID=UPI002A83DCC0|nr:hypothetical protein [Streptomyces sp. CRN 30]
MPEASGARRDPRDVAYGRAIESVSTVAAPLLAGGAVAMLGVVAADDDRFRWPGPATLFLTLAAVALVACVQWGFRARTFLYVFEEGSPEADDDPSLPVAARAFLARRRETDLARWRRGTALAALCYNLGLVAIGTGVSLAAAPPADAVQAGWRWAAFWVMSLATVAELLWVVLEWGDAAARAATRRRWLRRAGVTSGEGRGQ